MTDKPVRRTFVFREGRVSKGGRNPPNPGTWRPPAPQGSGGQAAGKQQGQDGGGTDSDASQGDMKDGGDTGGDQASQP
jgi:hypothetical protein